MSTFLLQHEPAVRFAAFAVVFGLMALFEVRAPRRQQALTRAQRWPSNLGIVLLNTVLVRVLMPTTAVALALHANAMGWGVFQMYAVPIWVAAPLSVVLLDLAIYLQHVLVHAVPALWRFHRMHHADLEFDVTTGARFHPVEILFSAVLKMIVIVAIGAPAIAVLIFEMALNATAMFNHSNVKLSPALDRALRRFVVTPDMHAIHHSIIPRETNSNFGFNLSCWDRLFGTYRAAPEAGYRDMTIGIDQFRNPDEQRIDRMLTQPFRDDEPLNRAR